MSRQKALTPRIEPITRRGSRLRRNRPTVAKTFYGAVMDHDPSQSRRSIALRGLLMTAVAVVLVMSSLAWFNSGNKIIGVVQLAIGGVLGVTAVVYGRWPRN